MNEQNPIVKLALEREMITEAQLDQCKEILKKSKRIGFEATLEEIIVKQGFLLDEQIEELRHISTLGVGDGTHFGPYRLGKLLGEGGMGKVYEAIHEFMGRPVAIKVINQEYTSDKTKALRFFQEVRALIKLDHPNIVTIYDAGRVHRNYYYAMELLPGPSLKGRVDIRKMLNEKEALSIIRSVARALGHAHEERLVHRDVKPENIIMNWDDQKAKWRPFLTDFDLAWFTTATQFTKEALGVVYYASPEQQATPMSASAHAPTTDIYSFGQLCNFATTGSNPVPLGVADNLSALKKRLGTGWTAQAAEAFAQLYGDCTHRKPDERPSGFEEVCDTLFRIMQALSEVSTTKAIPPERFVREVVFSTVGLSSDVQAAEGSFLTLSGKTRVTVQVSPGRAGAAELTYDVEAQEAPVVDGVHKFDQLRKTLLARLDSTLKGFNARKRYLATPFQILVQHFDVPLTLQGVAQSRALISRIIDVLEGK